MTAKNALEPTLRRLREMAHHRTEELRDALRGLLSRVVRNHTAAPSLPTPTTPSDVRPTLDTEPSTAFEALLRQQMQTLEQQLQDLRGRINDLFLLIVGTVALQAILRVAGI